MLLFLLGRNNNNNNNNNRRRCHRRHYNNWKLSITTKFFVVLLLLYFLMIMDIQQQQKQQKQSILFFFCHALTTTPTTTKTTKTKSKVDNNVSSKASSTEEIATTSSSFLRRKRNKNFGPHVGYTRLVLPSSSSSVSSSSSSSSSGGRGLLSALNKEGDNDNSKDFATLRNNNQQQVLQQQAEEEVAVVEFIVIGTSHFDKCQSSVEVATLINEIKPNGVVIELDPERTLRLTKQDSSFNNNNAAKHQKNEELLLFGADFLAAIKTSQKLNIPIFLGDESTKQTQQRFLENLIKPQSYTPTNLLKAIFLPRQQPTPTPSSSRTTTKNDDENNNKEEVEVDVVEEETPPVTTTTTITTTTKYVNLIQTFVNDPRKLIPIISTAIGPFLFLVFGSLPHYELSNTTTNITTFVALFISFLSICKVFNSVIVDRDEVLSDRTINASKILLKLKNNEAIRMCWKFPIDDDYVWKKPPTPSTTTTTTKSSFSDESKNDDNNNNNNDNDSPVVKPSSISTTTTSGITIPIFTLKTPLQKGMIRNLNLFEPRWLKMIDGITTTPTTATSSDEGRPQSQLFGCVSCINKFYSAIPLLSDDVDVYDDDGNNANTNAQEGRYADIIFERKGTIAQITGDIVEGNRPSGARKIGVKIKGGDNFFIQNEDTELSISDDGYIVMNNTQEETTTTTTTTILDEQKKKNNKIIVGNNANDGNKESMTTATATATATAAQDSSSELSEEEEEEEEASDDNTVKIVVVVGLLHANGVIQRLSRLS